MAEGSGQVHIVGRSDVDAALGGDGRVYLVGHLSKPQEALRHVGGLDQPIEVGLTRYGRARADEPHLHQHNVDMVYVLRGRYSIRLVGTGETHDLSEGDLYALEPNVGHVCVAEAGTEVLFIKSPGGNDKVKVALDSASAEWVADRMREFLLHTVGWDHSTRFDAEG